MNIDQETAKKLLVEGGTFVFLGVPPETQFGIDMQCWNTEEDFRGIKMIPPGLHYIHYSSVSKGSGDVGPRSGFMHNFQQKEFLVKMWDKKTEDMSKEEISDESIQRLKDNLLNLDRHLGPYPYDIWQKWKLLTSQMTAELVAKLSPECGIIRASVELLSTTDADRPRGVKSQSSAEKEDGTNPEESPTTDPLALDEAIPGQSDAKRAKRITQEEKEDAMLPDLKPAPGTAMRFTEIPRDKYPPGSTPEEITKHYLDQSYCLELMIAQHEEPLHIIGELQFAYICFLIGHSLEAFEHWKNLVLVLCSCDDAIHKYRSVFFHFIRTIEVQIEEMPEEMLADIVMNKNLVYKKLREFFRTAYVSKVDGRLLTMIERFKENLTEKLQWDFTGLDADEEDERPVVVHLVEETEID
ncbi:protein AAR2 homolog [Pectinophora gossypiella]|uniref:Protein AAR2 homolog n=2 Tax=Pectinophora gossypiella TaxID=13191 RepID=A0A1E1W634_PECGO|nr:protein AAR2 homolog [Pectinophora gossypiella]